jgi:DNA-binding NtrC family response regulator
MNRPLSRSKDEATVTASPEAAYRREMEQRGRWRRLVAEAKGEVVEVVEVFAPAPPDTGLDLKHNVRAIERLTIRAALREAGGHRPTAAKMLGISLRMLYYYLAQLR